MENYKDADSYIMGEIYKPFNFFKGFASLNEFRKYVNGRDIIIYGAGQMGKTLYKMLKKNNIAVHEIWDTNVVELKKQLLNDKYGSDVEIKEPNFSSEKYRSPLIIVVAGGDNPGESLCRKLWNSGFRDIAFHHDHIFSIMKFCCMEQKKNNSFRFDLNNCLRCVGTTHDESGGYCGFCDIYQKELMKSVGVEPKSDDKIVLSSLPVAVTTRCTLNCEMCGVGMGGPGGIDFPVDQLVSDINKVVDSVDFVNLLGPVGGELLLHKNLYELLTAMEKIPKIGAITLSTNGTVPLKDARIYKLLSSPRFNLRISSYEGIVSDNIQNNVKKFLQKLDEYGVVYKYHRVAEWYDYSDWSFRNYTEERLVKQSDCFGRGFYLYDGYLSQCCVSLVNGLKNKAPFFKEDHIYVRELNSDEISQRLKPIADPLAKRRVYSACAYCDGATPKNIPVAKQAKRR